MAVPGRSRLVVDVVACRCRVFRLPVPTAPVVRFRAQPKSFIAMQAAKMLLDVVVPCGTRREFVE